MSLTDRVRAALALDGDADPQARDEEPIAISEEERTQEPDRDEIELWSDEYYANPLIRQPVRNFAADVVEPGCRVDVGTDDGDDEPTVPTSYKFSEFRDMDLSAALELWLSQAAIVGGRFNRDISDLLEDVVIDLHGRRGTALVEHAYMEPTERNYILGLRLFQVETTTAYTREGKNILLRPDDDPGSYETVAVKDIGDPRLDAAPKTPADKTAAFVQFDDIFGSHDEKDDIPFALDDVTLIANDPDTGNIFGRPDTASVVDRSQELRETFEDTAQAIKALGYGHWIAQVDTSDEEEARKLLDGFDPSNPESANVVNYGVDVDEVDGQSPDNVDHIQQQIEYILAALPTPLYRVGFAGDINRDITDVQQDDYRDAVERERDRLESAFEDLLQMKAREFLTGDAHGDDDDGVPDVSLVIEPERDDNPLHDDAFDAEEFASVMEGAKAAAPGGAVDQIIPPHEVRETFLGLSPEPPEPPDSETDSLALPDEADDRVRDTFQEAYLANRYGEGDEVETPSGVGVVVDVYTSDGTFAGTAIDASDRSPTYIVATEGGNPAWEDFKAADLESTTIEVEGVDPVEAASEAEALADLAAATPDDEEHASLGVTDWDYPQSWQDSPTPNRVILLKAWAGMGGSFDGCQREMRGEIGRTAPFCAAMKDRVLLTEEWR